MSEGPLGADLAVTKLWDHAEAAGIAEDVYSAYSIGYASPLRNMSDGFAYRSPYRFAPVLPLTGTATFLRHPIA